jgi:hypothetical protein
MQTNGPRTNVGLARLRMTSSRRPRRRIERRRRQVVTTVLLIEQYPVAGRSLRLEAEADLE